MEEELKRIECLIERCNQCKLNACITCDICWSEVQAIENLLARNKELEEEVDSLVKQYEYQGALMVNEYFSKKQVFKHFIPISVIQNKIDWYKAYEGTVMYKKYNYEEIIQVLQKLLEERR